ncbi:MAG: hypothetical protein F6K04_01495 [Leptolyngbya sp. SIO4C5]|nr:hypothetical protein [Leptolyngbya sp. SIO4C5]
MTSISKTDFEIPPNPTGCPLYWRNEESGQLAPAITAYIQNKATPEELAIVKTYFEHWIKAPCWDENPYLSAKTKAELDQLREAIASAETLDDLHQWQNKALEAGHDPL